MHYITLYQKCQKNDLDILFLLSHACKEDDEKNNTDIRKWNLISDEKDDGFFCFLANAIFQTEVTREYDLVDGDITEEDIQKAVEIYSNEYDLSSIIPVLWDKERLWNRCDKISNGNFRTTIHRFTGFYRGSDDKAVKKFLFRKFPHKG